MANSLAQYLADLQVQIKEAESRLVFGVVISTSPLRVKYGEITLEDNFLFVEDGVALTVGQKVPMLKTNRSQLFIVMLSKEMTPQDILGQIKTVDGSGSGLDADLLDGKHASDFSLDGHTQDWTTITGKPSTFAPSAHNQSWTTITDKPTTATRWPAWTEVTEKPTTFPSNAHTHTLTDVTDLSSIMDVRSNGLGLAIGKASERDSFEVALPTLLHPYTSFRGTSSGIDNMTYLQFMERDGSTRQAWIGFGSSTNDDLGINNEVGNRIIANKDLYVNSNLVWHGGNSNVMVTSGSNTNGRYIRFSDGTQICWLTTQTATALNTINGSIFSTGSQTWTFPSAFTSAPSTSAIESAGIGSCWGSLGFAGTSPTITSFRLNGASSSSTRPWVSLLAVGRWKE